MGTSKNQQNLSKIGGKSLMPGFGHVSFLESLDLTAAKCLKLPCRRFWLNLLCCRVKGCSSKHEQKETG